MRTLLAMLALLLIVGCTDPVGPTPHVVCEVDIGGLTWTKDAPAGCYVHLLGTRGHP